MAGDTVIQSFTDQANQAMGMAKASSQKYEQMLGTYQTMLDNAMMGNQFARLYQAQWQRQMDYAGTLVNAFGTIAKATQTFVEQSLSETMPQLNDAVQQASKQTIDTMQSAASKVTRTA